jgi:alpha-L-fucosidase
MIYFDDTELPLGQAGLDITAYFYNANMSWHGGREEAVVAAKGYTPEHMGATMLDIERGRAADIIEAPWQTDTCIGDWHYRRSLFEQHQYKTPTLVAQSLVDIVSKNGNLMLNIPLRGDGTIDEDEHSFLEEFGRWMRVHGEAIYGTRPFNIFGEGVPDVTGSQNFNEARARPYNATDIRFTTKADRLYFFALGWPDDRRLRVKSLRSGNRLYKHAINAVQMLGQSGNLPFQQGPGGLEVTLPLKPPRHLDAYAFRILT